MKYKKRSFTRTNFTRNLNGFTLIELLISIGIISFLIITLSIAIDISAIRRRTRDAKRINDLKKIATALEAYFNVNGKYPNDLDPCDTSKGFTSNPCNQVSSSTATSWSRNPKGITLLEPKFMQEVPIDPLNKWPHVYIYEPVSNQTQFGASCEQGGTGAICAYMLSTALENDSNPERNPNCNGCIGAHNYCVVGGKARFHTACGAGP